MIKRGKTKEEKPDFEDMINEVEDDIQETDVEDAVIKRLAELRLLNTNIEKATDNLINATLQLESAIQQYQRAEAKLQNAVTTISNKVDTVNQHIDNVVNEAPSKLKVSVSVSNADQKTIQDMFDEEHRWVEGQMQKTLREVNNMFVAERRKTIDRYKEYDGCYLGHYAQWFFWFFFTVGIFFVAGVIAVIVSKHYDRF